MSQKIDLHYITALFGVVLLSCFFHEFAHWLTGELLGNDMFMSLNRASPVSGKYIHDWNANIVTISGPTFTILQAIVFYFILDGSKKVYLYPFLFFPFVYRFFAGLANMFSPNDEGRIGLHLGIGLYTLSIMVSVLLLLLIVRFSLKNNLGLKFNLLTFLLCSLALLAVVFADQYFNIRIFG